LRILGDARHSAPVKVRFPLACALLVAAVLLGEHVLQVRSGRQPVLPLEQMGVAVSLAAGRGFSDPFWTQSGPTAWVAPALPATYAACVSCGRWTGANPMVLIAAFNLLAAAGAVYLVLRWPLSLWSTGSRCVFAAAFLGYAALYQDFLTNSPALTAFEVSLLLAGLAGESRRPGSPPAWVMLAAANALLALTHPGLAMAGIIATLGLDGLIRAREPRGSLRFPRSGAFAVLVALAVGFAPWAIRNHSVLGQWIAVKSNGYFELVLSEDQTEDGVLSETSVVAGNPSTNLRLQREYCRLGERGFLEPYRARAREIVNGEPGRFALFSLNRFFNAVCYSRSPHDAELVGMNVPLADAAKLVGRRIILNFGQMKVYVWPLSRNSASVERSLLAAAGVGNIDGLMKDWERAQGVIRDRMTGPAAILRGMAWAGIPSLLCLATALVGRWSVPRPFIASAAIYLLALLPNVLITHDISHQADFAVLFALFAAALVEALARSRRSRATLA
jgi:hypothetical protein